MKILRKSGWTFDTSAGGGAGYGMFSTEGGIFVLDDLEGNRHRYFFSAFGPSLSWALTSLLRIPKLALPKIIVKGDELSGSAATSNFKSYGKLFLTESFKRGGFEGPAEPRGWNGISGRGRRISAGRQRIVNDARDQPSLAFDGSRQTRFDRHGDSKRSSSFDNGRRQRRPTEYGGPGIHARANYL